METQNQRRNNSIDVINASKSAHSFEIDSLDSPTVCSLDLPHTKFLFKISCITFIRGPGYEWMLPLIYIILIIISMFVALFFPECDKSQPAKKFFYISAVICILDIIMVSFTDPGHVKNTEADPYATTDPEGEYWKCEICKIPETQHRTEHCFSCNVCVRYLDHHCPVMGNCIGRNNIVCFYFLLFSFTAYFVGFMMFLNMGLIKCPEEGD